MPEEVIVLETVAPVDDFIVAVRKIDGLEWLGEIEEDDIPPDDDFFIRDKKTRERSEKMLRGRLFLVFSNQQALQQILSLWNDWKANRKPPFGLAKWATVFSLLRDVRRWGVEDRLEETGVLSDWRERVAHNDEIVPCEVELWFHVDPQRRQAARERLKTLLAQSQGEIVSEAILEEIAYHALLVRLPIASVRSLLNESRRDSALVQCEQVQFFRASGQMVGVVVGDESINYDSSPGDVAPLREPVVALFDGLPLQNHRYLRNRLIIDDPDDFGTDYPAADRRHGTAMASLIAHGDLTETQPPLTRAIYVRPILRPDRRDWRQPREESVPEGTLVVDLLHRAVRRMLEGDGKEPPVAPRVCVVNLSFGIRDRPFDAALSPLARLLDWLAWKYRVLFVVSAGNHTGPIRLPIPRGMLGSLHPADRQHKVLQFVASEARHRRLLSPAESLNALTVGAIHDDASTSIGVARAISPFVDPQLPSVINAQGMGYRRSIKPDVLLPGGKVVLTEGLTTPLDGEVHLEVYKQTRAPGHFVAAPGPNPGDEDYRWYTRGTSNAAALATRGAALLNDVLDELEREPGGELISRVPRAIWIKALLAHSARWGSAGQVLERLLKTPDNGRQLREYLTRLLGYGCVTVDHVRSCTSVRVTALGGGSLQVDQSHLHRFPLPPSLSGKPGLRRIVVTLAWFSPVNPDHRAWRRADLWFEAPESRLLVKRSEADSRAVQRGTLQHEMLHGERAVAFLDGHHLTLQVNCRADAGTLEVAVPYALALTLEVAADIGIDIYSEVRARLRARAVIAP